SDIAHYSLEFITFRSHQGMRPCQLRQVDFLGVRKFNVNLAIGTPWPFNGSNWRPKTIEPGGLATEPRTGLDFIENRSGTVKKFAIAAIMIALLPASAYAQQQKGPPTAKSDSEKKRDAEIDQAYRQVIKGTEGKAKPVKVDPW